VSILFSWFWFLLGYLLLVVCFLAGLRLVGEDGAILPDLRSQLGTVGLRGRRTVLAKCRARLDACLFYYCAPFMLLRRVDGYSLTLLLRWASWSFLMSAGDNCGRSTLIVSLLSLAVRGKGGL